MNNEKQNENQSINFWAPENYVIKTVTGSEEQCETIFKQELVSYPNLVFGTHIKSKQGLGSGKFSIVICRFVNQSVCLAHCLLPPTYVREGKVL